MAQYYDNFSGATVGAGHPDFSVLFGSLTITTESTSILPGSDAHVLLEHVTGSFLRNAAAWNVGATSGETTVRALVEFRVSGSIPGSISGVILSATGTTSTRTGYVQWYRAGSGDYDLTKYNGGSDTAVASATIAESSGVVVQKYMEIYRNGSLIELRSWDFNGGTRPETADISYTDPSPLAVSGAFGLSHLTTGDNTGFRGMRVYEIMVATDGDPLITSDPNAPTITDINTNNELIPGTTATITGTNLSNTTGVTVGGETQADVTAVSATEVTFTVVRGGNPYNQDLTAQLTATDGIASITVQQVPESGTFAVTAASPNTVDDASIWTGLVDTTTSDPITIVNGDQAWVKNPNNLTNLSVAPDGTITADIEGNFVVQIWLASEGVWGSDQTVTFTEDPGGDVTGPTITSVNVPTAGSYGIGDNLPFTVNFDEAAIVTGTPRLPVNLTTGTVYADYASGTGTTAIVFTGVVQESDNDADGITLGSIELNGGTIQDASTNNATLTLAGVENTAGILVDGVRPVITVTGENPYTITVGETYTDPGATASDNQDGSLGSVTGTGTVDEQTEGQYTITYPGAGVVDSAGNVALDVTRTVNVNAAPGPDDWPFSKGIKYAATKNWTWGNRHPKTGTRVRIFK